MEIHQTNQFVVIVKKRDLLALCRSSFWICNSFFSDLQGTNQFASEFMKLFVGKRVIQLMSNDGRGKNWLFQSDTRIKTSKSWWKRKSVFCEHVVCLVLGVPGWLLCEGSPQQQHRRVAIHLNRQSSNGAGCLTDFHPSSYLELLNSILQTKTRQHLLTISVLAFLGTLLVYSTQRLAMCCWWTF